MHKVTEIKIQTNVKLWHCETDAETREAMMLFKYFQHRHMLAGQSFDHHWCLAAVLSAEAQEAQKLRAQLCDSSAMRWIVFQRSPFRQVLEQQESGNQASVGMSREKTT